MKCWETSCLDVIFLRVMQVCYIFVVFSTTDVICFQLFQFLSFFDGCNRVFHLQWCSFDSPTWCYSSLLWRLLLVFVSRKVSVAVVQFDITILAWQHCWQCAKLGIIASACCLILDVGIPVAHTGRFLKPVCSSIMPYSCVQVCFYFCARPISA